MPSNGQNLQLIRDLDPTAKIMRNRKTGERRVKTAIVLRNTISGSRQPIAGKGSTAELAVVDWFENLTLDSSGEGMVLQAGGRTVYVLPILGKWTDVTVKEARRTTNDILREMAENDLKMAMLTARINRDSNRGRVIKPGSGPNGKRADESLLNVVKTLIRGMFKPVSPTEDQR